MDSRLALRHEIDGALLVRLRELGAQLMMSAAIRARACTGVTSGLRRATTAR